MNEVDINKIRDAASVLRESEPKLAYQLFSLALKHRPNGHYILQSYKELKAELKTELGIKSFVVIGNCQAGVIANLIAEKSNKFVIDKLITVHLPDDDRENIYDILDRADYIVAQNIRANFIGIDTDTIQKKYPQKIVKILNLHFSGFHQDWGYMPKIAGVRSFILHFPFFKLGLCYSYLV
jgi:hypothetical protein